MFDWLKNLINAMNERGIPLPMIRVNENPSLTATMVFLSFNTALLGQLGKVTKFLGEVDLSQANYLLLICLGAYLGRTFQKKGKEVTLSAEETKDE